MQTKYGILPPELQDSVVMILPVFLTLICAETVGLCGSIWMFMPLAEPGMRRPNLHGQVPLLRSASTNYCLEFCFNDNVSIGGYDDTENYRVTSWKEGALQRENSWNPFWVAFFASRDYVMVRTTGMKIYWQYFRSEQILDGSPYRPLWKFRAELREERGVTPGLRSMITMYVGKYLHISIPFILFYFFKSEDMMHHKF